MGQVEIVGTGCLYVMRGQVTYVPRALSEIQVLLNKTATDSTDPELKTAEGGEEGAWEESGLCNPTTDRRERGRGWGGGERRRPQADEAGGRRRAGNRARGRPSSARPAPRSPTFQDLGCSCGLERAP